MKKLTPSEAKQKIFRYCAYQERSHLEVKNKLYEYGLYKNDVEEIITQLITDGFLNEERFAKAFAGGKFRMKQWGRIKIVHALEGKGLTQNCIKSGMKEIEEASYIDSLKNILLKKSTQLGELDSFLKRDKLAKYAIQKGYEPDLVWRVLKEEMP